MKKLFARSPTGTPVTGLVQQTARSRLAPQSRSSLIHWDETSPLGLETRQGERGFRLRADSCGRVSEVGDDVSVAGVGPLSGAAFKVAQRRAAKGDLVALKRCQMNGDEELRGKAARSPGTLRKVPGHS